MSDTPITEGQQYRLDHIRAAEIFDDRIADYARSEALTPKELYSWKGILARRGLLGDTPPENSAGFVRVIALSIPLGKSLGLANGVRLEWHGELRGEQFEALVLTASRLQ